ncbi:hypothetical protein Golob_005630 [Gossypium lobatum]|uniref:RNase H type-1 domain-containing protein n=1 Tax=Gossypium lobatum TaxID=34289 RepID=A0A7J8MTR9_9ROSI|nr:hypothetical protein [Gossypium lobatum]
MRSLAISRASHPHIHLKDPADYLGVILQLELSPLKATDVEIEMTRAEPLAGEWTYLNTDGTIRVDSRATATGGVLREKNGEWILGYSKYLGNCSILDAKL